MKYSKRSAFHLAGLASLAVTLSLACTLSSLGSQVSGIQATAQAIATTGGEIVATVKAIATQQAPLIATAQAMVTQQGPSALATAKAFATQQAPLLETAKAYATEHGPELLQTAQAAATQFAVGQPPEDIPILARETAENFFGSKDVVSYATALPSNAVVDFYKTAMLSSGWQEVRSEWTEAAGTAILKYEKPNRYALVTITASGNKTLVLIGIQIK
jgi:hypothetical protein